MADMNSVLNDIRNGVQLRRHTNLFLDDDRRLDHIFGRAPPPRAGAAGGGGGGGAGSMMEALRDALGRRREELNGNNRAGGAAVPPHAAARAGAGADSTARDELEFVDRDSIDEELCCCICVQPFTDPICVPCCGHIYCKVCIGNWATQEKTCPTCRARLLANQLNVPVNQSLKKLVGKCRIYCQRRSQGCGAIHTRAEIEAHVAVCEYEFVSCPHAGCTETRLRRKNVSEHSSQCGFRVEAHACGKSIIFKDLAEHCARDCPVEPMQCSACNTMVPRATMPLHTAEECTSTSLRCVNSDIGCHVVGTRADLTAHHQACLYASMRGYIEETYASIGALRDEVQEIHSARGGGGSGAGRGSVRVPSLSLLRRVSPPPAQHSPGALGRPVQRNSLPDIFARPQYNYASDSSSD